MFLLHLRLRSDVVALRKIARNRTELVSGQPGCMKKAYLDLTHHQMIDAPDNRNNLSPIWIGNTFRAGRTIGIAGSVSVRRGPPLVAPCGLAASMSLADGRGLLSDVSVALRRRCGGPLCDRVLCAGGATGPTPVGDPSSSVESHMIRDDRF